MCKAVRQQPGSGKTLPLARKINACALLGNFNKGSGDELAGRVPCRPAAAEAHYPDMPE